MLSIIKIDKYKIVSIVLSVILFTTFIFPEQLRIALLGNQLGLINFLAFFCIILLTLLTFNNYNKSYLFILCVASVYILVIGFFYQSNIKNTILSYLNFTIPLFLIPIKLNKDNFRKFFLSFVKVINFAILIITLGGIIDFLFNNIFMDSIVNMMGNDFQRTYLTYRSQDIWRLYSIYGSPLMNVELYLIFYIVNHIKNRYFVRVKFINLIKLIAIIGIGLTSSKVGLVLALLTLVLVRGTKKGMTKTAIYTGGILLFLFICLNLGLFNNTLERFSTGSLSTGRSEAWNTFKNLNLYPIKIFSGYGLNFTFELNNIVPYLSAAFEYPFRMFSLEYGVLQMIFIYSAIAIYPFLYLIKRKHYYLLVALLIVFLDVNTFNGLSLLGDYMLIFCIYIFLILNSSLYIEGNKN